MPKLWMSGVGTLCAIARYQVALLYFILIDIKNFRQFRKTVMGIHLLLISVVTIVSIVVILVLWF